MRAFVRAHCTLICIAALMVLFAGSVSAERQRERPEISDLAVIHSGAELVASFRLQAGFTEDIAERVQSGLPTTLSYRIELERGRRWWFNRGVESGVLQVVAMYNALTREYLVNTKWEGRLIETQVVKSIDALRQLMTIVQELPFARLDPEASTDRLIVRVRAEMGSKNILWMFPTSVHTDWSETRSFRRVEPSSATTD